MKLTEIEIKKLKKNTESNLNNIQINLSEKNDKLTLVIDLTRDFNLSSTGKSIVVASARNHLLKIGDILAQLNLSFFIPKSKNGLK